MKFLMKNIFIIIFFTFFAISQLNSWHWGACVCALGEENECKKPLRIEHDAQEIEFSDETIDTIQKICVEKCGDFENFIEWHNDYNQEPGILKCPHQDEEKIEE